MPGRIRKAKIKFLSLCAKGRNKLPALYKADDNLKQFQPIVKELEGFDERGELLAVVYSPGHLDTDQHFSDAEVIREFAYDYMQNSGQIDIHHDGQQVGKDRAYIAQSFIIDKGDTRFSNFRDRDGVNVDVSGGWAVVVKLEDEALRKSYREGGWDGISMGGEALIEAVDKHQVTKSGDDMDPTVLKALLEQQTTNLSQALTSSVTAAMTQVLEKAFPPKKEEPKPEESVRKAAPPINVPFVGSKDNPEDVQAHAVKLQKAQLEAAVDWNDINSVTSYHAQLAKMAKSQDGDSDELEKARREAREANERLQKAERSTNRPVYKAVDGDKPKNPHEVIEDFFKSESPGDPNRMPDGLLDAATAVAAIDNEQYFAGHTGG